jgi:choline dehydrogenase-like flavoprotein
MGGKPVDFVVVGAGAAGGVVANELAQAGFEIVVLEQGPYLHERDFRHDEIWALQQHGLTNDQRLYRWFMDRALELLTAAGAARLWEFPLDTYYPAVHLLGTCRMGNDPRRSVVDRFHRTHDVPNLFLVDGSSFVTGGRGQPTCTIQALAFRAGHEIARLARQGTLGVG